MNNAAFAAALKRLTSWRKDARPIGESVPRPVNESASPVRPAGAEAASIAHAVPPSSEAA